MKVTNMQNIIQLLAISTLLSVLVACKPTVTTPVAKCQANKTQVGVNETLEFTFTGSADQVVIFTGDNGHIYSQRNSKNTGVVLPKKYLTHSYATPGTYQAVFVASCYGDKGADLKQDTCSVWITVTDNNCSIKTMYAKAFYDELHAKQVGENWLIALPKQVYAGKKFMATPTKMMLTIALYSDSSKVEVNGSSYVAGTKYDFTSSIALRVKAYSGAEQSSTLYTMWIPEFATLSINGVAASFERDKFSYYNNASITLPAGTDKTKLVPVFTLFEGQTVWLDGQQIVSGVSQVDFTNPVTFTVRNTDAQKSELVTESQIKVTVL